MVDVTKEKHAFKIIRIRNIEEMRIVLADKSQEPWNYFDESNNTILHKSIHLDDFKMSLLIIDSINYMLNYNLEIPFKMWINKKNNEGFTCLHYASFRGNMDLIRILVHHGADYNSVNNQGQTVMHLASQGNKASPLIYFKEKYGLSLTKPDKNGSTPLHYACYTGAEEAFMYLYYEDIEIDLVDNDGLTSLHLAVMSERTRIIKRLIYKGANYKIKDNSNRTPLELAIEKDKINVVKLLSKTEKFNFFSFSLPLQKLKRDYYNIIIFVILHLFLEGLTFFILIPINDSKVIGILFLILFFTVMSVFIILAVSNPGKLKRDSDSMLQLVEENCRISDYCSKCIVKKKSKSMHCILCDYCVEDFDHHCYWVNKCIGKNNKKYFFLMLGVVSMNLVFNIFCAIRIWSLDFNKKSNFNSAFPEKISDSWISSQPVIYILSILLFGICMFFLVPIILLIWFNIKTYFNRKKTARNDSFTLKTCEKKVLNNKTISMFDSINKSNENLIV